MEEMTRERALELLRGGKDGVREWNEYWRGWEEEGTDLLDTSPIRRQIESEGMRYLSLTEANLTGAYLRGVDLRGICLREANLSRANLCRANLFKADLTGTNLSGADLTEADLGLAIATNTVFGSDLSTVKNLDEVLHYGPSVLSPWALKSLGKRWPESFLRGCGLTPWETLSVKLHDLDLTPEDVSQIVTDVAALRMSGAIQVRPVFMSYSHADASYVDALQQALYDAGINVWRDIHDAPAGPLEPIVHEAMENRLILLVLSAASTESDWVEHEVRRARRIAKEQDRHVLNPIALDDSWKTCKWPERLREQVEEYNILDFSHWQDEEQFQAQFRRLGAGIRKWY